MEKKQIKVDRREKKNNHTNLIQKETTVFQQQPKLEIVNIINNNNRTLIIGNSNSGTIHRMKYILLHKQEPIFELQNLKIKILISNLIHQMKFNH